jgi:hypothetical protein
MKRTTGVPLPILGDEPDRAEPRICPLCGARASFGSSSCAVCPMGSRCDVLCCPNCGYEFVEKSVVYDFLQGLFRRLRKRLSGTGRREGVR